MSTFFLLPPRPQLGRRFGESLEVRFPGLCWLRADWPDMAETLATAARCHSDVYVVHREDLPDGQRDQSLIHSFGAEPGDDVVEVMPGDSPRRWKVA